MLVKSGTASSILQRINSQISKEPLLSGAANKKFSLTFNCASLESVTLKPIPVNAQLNQLKSYISKVETKFILCFSSTILVHDANIKTIDGRI